MTENKEKKEGCGSCCSGTANLIKPPLVERAVVVVINDVTAADFLAVEKAQFPALDAVAGDGCGCTLMTRPTEAVLDEMVTSPRVEIHRLDNLAAAEEFVFRAQIKVDKDVKTLIAVLISGPGDWSKFYKAIEELDDEFIIPKQTFSDSTVPQGVAVWASPARSRVDYRKWISDPIPPAEGAISSAQACTEILAKVGLFPKFGA